jgi:hypothetical protein
MDTYIETASTSKFYSITSPDLIESVLHKYLKDLDIRHKLNPYKYEFPFTINKIRIKFRILKIDAKTSCVRFDCVLGKMNEFLKFYKEIRDVVLAAYNNHIWVYKTKEQSHEEQLQAFIKKNNIKV